MSDGMGSVGPILMSLRSCVLQVEVEDFSVLGGSFRYLLLADHDSQRITLSIGTLTAPIVSQSRGGERGKCVTCDVDVMLVCLQVMGFLWMSG